MVSSVTSDRDYLEIVASNDITMNANSAQSDADGQLYQTVMGRTNGSTTTITHNVGSIPIVRGFYDPGKNGRLYNTPRYTTGGYLAESSGPVLISASTTTSTKLILNSDTSITSVPVYYRIYRFGDKGTTSDERIDNIFTKGSDDRTLSAAASSFSPVGTTVTIPHGRGAQILWKVQFSDNGSDWYNEGSVLFGSADTSTGPPGGPYSNYYYMVAYGSADSTNFYITYVHNYPSSKTIYVRYVLELKESSLVLSSDFDAYRSDGVVQTRTVTFSGTVGGGAERTISASAFSLTDQDFQQIMFGNSVYSPGKYRDLSLEWGTIVNEVTFGSPVGVSFEPHIVGNNLTISCKVKNPYSSTITLQSTTVTFRFAAYDSTLL